MSQIDTEAIKQRFDLRALAGQYTDLKRKTTKEMAGPCPRCGGDDRFYTTADYFACRNCHDKRGDVIEFVCWLDGLTFVEACERLAGGDLPTLPEAARPTPPPPAPKLTQPPPEDWQDKALAAVVKCQDVLWSGAGLAPGALGYLRDRGLSDDTIQDALLGYQPNDGEVCGVWVPQGITIPCWHKAANTLWGVNVKRGGKDPGPKYKAVKDSQQSALYLADNLRGRDVAVICEGEFDALLLAQQAGDLAAVCTFGGATMHGIEAWLPYLLHIKRLLIATDNDPAGWQAWDYWKAKTKRARRLIPPGDVKDITDAHTAGADLRAWLTAGLEANR